MRLFSFNHFKEWVKAIFIFFLLNELVDVEEVLQDAVEDLKVNANKNNIELKLNIDNIIS